MKMIQGTWPLADWRVELPDIHIWTISLETTASTLSAFTRTLSASEIERAQGFHFDLHRDRFIAGRGCMRLLLSRYLATEPEKVVFAQGPHGKPFLSGAFTDSGLNFNLTRSENVGLFAVTRSGSIGIDLERIQPLADIELIVESCLSTRESVAFHKLDAEEKLVAFSKLWTRKEAWLKATGEGIGRFLKEVEVSFLPGELAQFFRLPASSQSQAHSILQDLELVPGFVAALAVSARVIPSRCYCFAERATGKALAQSI